MKKSILTLILFFYLLPTFSQTKVDTLIFNHINEYRISNGIHPLIWDTATYELGVKEVSFMDNMANDTTYKDSLYVSQIDTNWVGENFTTITHIFGIETISTQYLSYMIFKKIINFSEYNKLILDPTFNYGSISNKITKNASVLIENPETYELYIVNDYWDGIYTSFQCKN